MSAQLSPVYFVVPVWGEAYVNLFTEVCLPAQLAPGNIPSLPNIGRCQYHIYTTRDDYNAVFLSAAFKKLETLINASIHVIEPPRTADERYDKKSEIYRAAIRRASKDDAVNFFLNADIVLADGFVRRTTELLAAGKRVIELPGPRTVKEAVRNALLRDYLDPDGAIVISPRQLTALSIKHLHPLEAMHYWESQGTDERFHPSHLYWPVGTNSLLARCIHLYPIVVHPRDRLGALRFDTTIDDDLVQRACPAMEDTHVVTNSDEMFCCELSSAEHFVGNMGTRGDVESVVDFFFSYGKERNAKLLKYPIRMIGADEPAADWKRAEAEAENVIAQVIDRAGLREVYEDRSSQPVRKASAAHSPAAAERALPFAALPEPGASPRKLKSPPALSKRAARPKLRMLVAVWGEHHCSLFLDYALPSLLAADNIPLLAEHFECDFEFLTMLDDVEKLRAARSVKLLERYASVHYTEIDDLQFRHSYGILLTFAFARGIAARQEEMTNTYFVFLNADFVFSNGSLRSMLKALQEGYNAVVVPSFRCVSEDFIARMRSGGERDKGSEPVLSLSARSLVRTALDMLHPTFKAKTVNQDGPHTTLVNQFLWKVDENTMVGRFYLLFMLCVKPEMPLDEVIGFCDYTLVPQLVPSGKVKILTDSDDAFLLELQHRDHEGGDYYVPERPSTEFLAERLSEWTTPLHRHYAAQDLIFHAKDLPKNLRATTAVAKEFVDGISSRLGPPRPYRNHEYWTGTLAAMKVDPDGIPVLSRRSGVSAGESSPIGEAASSPADMPKKLRKLVKKKHVKLLREWAEHVEETAAGHRRAIANLRAVRDRMSAKIHDLRQQLTDLETRRQKAESSLAVPDRRVRNDATEQQQRRLDDYETRCKQLDAELGQVLSTLARRFDRDYYVRNNPDVVESGLDPETHYRTVGWKRGSDPSPYFSVRGYLAVNPDVKAAEMDPLEHFCRYGFREDRKGWRKAFIDEPERQSWPPAALVDAPKPVAAERPSRWMPSLFKRPRKRTAGERELVVGSGFFDPEYYLKTYPDVAESKCDPVDHYLQHGALEGRRPSRIFDAAGYLRENPDVQAAGVNPIVHWMQHGRFEDRPSPLRLETLKVKA